MRISDWSADGCSADLAAAGRPRAAGSRGGKPDRPSERRRAAAGAAPEPRHDRRSARSGDSLSRPRNYPDLPTLAAFAPCRQANIATLFSSWNGQEAPLPDRRCTARAAAPQGQGPPLGTTPGGEAGVDAPFCAYSRQDELRGGTESGSKGTT